jgi:hypothetical protein
MQRIQFPDLAEVDTCMGEYAKMCEALPAAMPTNVALGPFIDSIQFLVRHVQAQDARIADLEKKLAEK